LLAEIGVLWLALESFEPARELTPKCADEKSWAAFELATTCQVE
jgi:hypothetical protein